jgi:two-component system cell cycle response regulator
VLIDLATLVQSLLRTEDVFARYGGEEFVIILRGIALDDAGVLAERVRKAVDEHQFLFGQQRLPVTISAGVAAVAPEIVHAVDLVEAADNALYAAKNAGRNQVLLKHPEGA